MKERLIERPENPREALLVKLAKELGFKPAAFLAMDPGMQRAFLIGRIASIAQSSSVSEESEDMKHKVWMAGLDAGVLRPEDEKHIFG